MSKISAFFKDKFVLTMLVVTVLIFGAGVWFARQMTKPAAESPVNDAKQELLTITAADHVRGNSQATVTLIEYLDFECSVCGTYYPLMKNLEEEFGGQVQFVYRYFPLTGHRNALNAALAAEAAHLQGKYQEMFDLLFAKQTEWGGKTNSDRQVFEGYAQELGLDLEKFRADAVSKEVRERVERDLSSGRQLGVNSTPSFFLGGERIPNPRTLEDFRTLINAALLKAPKIGEEALGEKTHEHADIKIYLNGQQLDLTQEKYQSTEEKELNANTHLHDGNGDVIHKHREGVTIGYFLKSLGIEFSQDCLVLDTGERYCTDEQNELKFRVNGQANGQFGQYEFMDLDKILISFGPKEEDISTQLQSISDDACMYSEKCPEKGTPPTENCVGGLGTDC